MHLTFLSFFLKEVQGSICGEIAWVFGGFINMFHPTDKNMSSSSWVQVLSGYKTKDCKFMSKSYIWSYVKHIQMVGVILLLTICFPSLCCPSKKLLTSLSDSLFELNEIKYIEGPL